MPSPTDIADADQVASNFGLIPRSYDSDAEFDPDGRRTQWERFEYQINKLNEESGPDTSYRLLFLGRHGEGYHNVAERRYGREAWDVSISANALYPRLLIWAQLTVTVLLVPSRRRR